MTVWVGVPDDPYIDDKTQLTTVDVQLREGRAVLASVSTVLEPDQVAEARRAGTRGEGGARGRRDRPACARPRAVRRPPALTGRSRRLGAFSPAMGGRRSLGIVHGTALYLGALVGPGLLLVPALAAQEAGAASIVAWVGLLAVSAPLAVTFGALGVRHPVAGGVSTYVREGLGDDAAAVTGGWFLTAILIGAPAAALIGGYYVAALTDSGTTVATSVGFVMYAAVLGANLLGLRVSAGFQLGLMSVLVVVIALAVAVALPSHGGDNWKPFAPHGWWAVGTAANILMWLFFGWEAVAQLAGDFRRPAHDLPRAIALAYAIIAVLYLALAVATIGVTAGTSSHVPLADLISVGFGRAGRDATAVLAVALTMGTMNVYLGGAAKLGAALAVEGSLPAWFAGDAERSVPRRPLGAISRRRFRGAGRARGRARQHRRSRASDVGAVHRRVRACARVGGRGSSTAACVQPRPSRSRQHSCFPSSRRVSWSCR